jgi:hypothetical protein
MPRIGRMLRSRSLFVVTLLLAGAASAVAHADIQTGVPEEFPSKHELSAHLGFQAGYGAQLGSTSGFKLDGEYAYRFHPLIWFDANLANVFGFGSADGVCTHSVLATCYRGGWALEMAAGIKVKIATRIPLVVEVPVLLGVDVLYNRDCGDDGAGVPILKTGAGVKYFVTKKIGVGAKLDAAFGPSFHQSSVCKQQSYTDFFGYFDFLVGAEFVL